MSPFVRRYVAVVRGRALLLTVQMNRLNQTLQDLIEMRKPGHKSQDVVIEAEPLLQQQDKLKLSDWARSNLKTPKRNQVMPM